MSEPKTPVKPELEIKPSINPNLKPTDTVMPVAIYVTPRNFDGSVALVQPVRLASLILDISASMKGDKIEKTKLAAEAFVNAIPETDYFSIIAFGRTGSRVYPTKGAPVKATPANKAAAKAAIKAIAANEGNTKVSYGMSQLREDFNALQKLGVVEGYAGLLTDGENDGGDGVFLETGAVNEEGRPIGQVTERVATELALYRELRDHTTAPRSLRILPRAVGVSEHDGDAWRKVYNLLEAIADQTMAGSEAKALGRPDQLKADFEELAQQSAKNILSGVKLVIRTQNNVKLVEAGITAPVEIPLLKEVKEREEGQSTIREVALGPWDDETRLFYFELDVGAIKPPPPVDTVVACIAWFEYTMGGQVYKTPAEKVFAKWTTLQTMSLSQHVAAGVREAQGIKGSQRRKRDAAQFIEAAQKGENVAENTESARIIFADLVKAAHEAGDAVELEALAQFVDIKDAATGDVKLKAISASMAVQVISNSKVREVRRPEDTTSIALDSSAPQS